MAAYMEAWKTFRLLSNENEVTATHLVSQPGWPLRDGCVICDLGCGDGRLLESIVIRSPATVAEARLVDPDADLLFEAGHRLTETGLLSTVQTVFGAAEDVFQRCAEGIDVALMAHVVYLMPNEAVQRVFEMCPTNAPLFVILDAPDSVFTSLWRHTAPKYHARAMAAHETISSLDAAEFSVAQTTVTSRIDDPLELPRTDVQNAILSLLCYAPVESIVTKQVRSVIETTLHNFKQRGAILCRSSCYQIERRQP